MVMKRSLDKFLESSDVQTAAKPPLITILKCSRERCWTRLSVPLSYVFKNGFLGKRNSSLNTLQSVHLKKKFLFAFWQNCLKKKGQFHFILFTGMFLIKFRSCFFRLSCHLYSNDGLVTGKIIVAAAA